MDSLDRLYFRMFMWGVVISIPLMALAALVLIKELFL
jgi:tetrahydromethanopterin S-methyltransferase subunit B